MASEAQTDPVRSDGGRDPLAPIRTDLPPREVLNRLEALARAGNLPGYERDGDGAFCVEIFAEPFDRTMEVRVDCDHDGSTRLTPRIHVALRTPAIFLVVTALTVWPGVWLTDSMLRTYFAAYSFPTWIWYIPLTVLPLPWVARSMIRKSAALAHESVNRQLERITVAINGTPAISPPAQR